MVSTHNCYLTCPERRNKLTKLTKHTTVSFQNFISFLVKNVANKDIETLETDWRCKLEASNSGVCSETSDAVAYQWDIIRFPIIKYFRPGLFVIGGFGWWVS